MGDLRRVGAAGEDHADMDALAAQLLAHDLKEAVEREFRCDIRRVRRDALFAVHRDGDDQMTAALRAEMRQNRIGRGEIAEKIVLHHPAKLLLRQLCGRAAEIDPRVAVADMYRAEAFYCVIDGGFELLLVADIGKQHLGLYAQRPDLVRNGVQPRLVAGDQRDICALLCQRKRCRPSDAGGRACDDGIFSDQLLFHCYLPSSRLTRKIIRAVR